MATRHGVNTGNMAIGCDNLSCINSVMDKIPKPYFDESQAVELWNTRFDNDANPKPDYIPYSGDDSYFDEEYD